LRRIRAEYLLRRLRHWMRRSAVPAISGAAISPVRTVAATLPGRLHLPAVLIGAGRTVRHHRARPAA
jgi:hypothetical protein